MFAWLLNQFALTTARSSSLQTLNPKTSIQQRISSTVAVSETNRQGSLIAILNPKCGKENGNYYNGLYRDYRVTLGLYWGNGKENGNYCNGVG